METISLKVSPAVASAFEKADNRLKRKAEILANILFESLLKPNAASNKLETILDKGAAEVAANGFTPDQLEDLLKEGE